jgi:hypothetical protein
MGAARLLPDGSEAFRQEVRVGEEEFIKILASLDDALPLTEVQVRGFSEA